MNRTFVQYELDLSECLKSFIWDFPQRCTQTMFFQLQILRDASDELLNVHKVSIDSLYKDGCPGIWAKFSAEY